MSSATDAERPNPAELARRLADISGFAGLDARELREIAGQFEFFSLNTGETLVEQGEKDDTVFVLLDGRLAVTVAVADAAGTAEATGARVPDLEPGSIVGEVAMMAGGGRSATVRAVEPSRVAALNAAGFNQLLERHPESAAALARVTSQRLREGQLAAQMASLFADLDPKDLRALERKVRWVSLSAGETLFHEGDPGDGAFMVVSGRLVAKLRQPDGGMRTAGEISRGELVGEYALIMDQPRGATVIAKKDTDLAWIPRDTFMELIASRPKILLEVTRTIIRRTDSPQARARRDRNQNRSISVVHLDPHIRDDDFCASLAIRLEARGRTTHLDSRRIGEVLNKPGIAASAAGHPAHIRLLQWLGHTESTHRFVIYETDDEFTLWTERAIRHADEIVLVADARNSPGLRNIEHQLAAMRETSEQRTCLVLVHDAATKQPKNTKAWLTDRKIDAVYHVRRGNASDLGRLGRLLSGSALGIVFGGGGARGFAHLGVLRALEELGIPIDLIGGTSIGAPLAHLPAQDLSAEQTLAVIKESFSSLFDYTLPLTSLLAGVRITRMIERFSADWDIEDLWRPFFCVSTNLTTAREIHHLRGRSDRALRASVSIPGVLPPVPDGRHLLVDGGVMNNLPIDIMRALNPTGSIIAVDVTPTKGPSAKSDYGLAVSGWRIAANKLNPFGKSLRVPSVATTILRSMLVGADRIRTAQVDSQLADLYLNIDILNVGLLEFDRVDEIAAIGYHQSLAAIRSWLESGGFEA